MSSASGGKAPRPGASPLDPTESTAPRPPLEDFGPTHLFTQIYAPGTATVVVAVDYNRRNNNDYFQSPQPTSDFRDFGFPIERIVDYCQSPQPTSDFRDYRSREQWTTVNPPQPTSDFRDYRSRKYSGKSGLVSPEPLAHC
jgi:hypothetical protein